MIPFTKMHGAGNDFAVFDGRHSPLAFSAGTLRLIADRRRGIGCDQIILLSPADDAGVFMHIFNPDGSEASACGNATRCVAALLAEETGQTDLTIRTIAGLLPAKILGPGLVEVDMGPPALGWEDIPLAAPADTLHLPLALGPVSDPAACSMGNPHATFFVDSLDHLPLPIIGPKLETHKTFPARANIGFAVVEAPDRIRLKVWERGAGLTLACGSGACAALVNAHRRGLTGSQASVEMDGGTLLIRWEGHVFMRGPAVTAYIGEWG
jgi:diaminopimelate epimerase